MIRIDGAGAPEIQRLVFACYLQEGGKVIQDIVQTGEAELCEQAKLSGIFGCNTYVEMIEQARLIEEEVQVATQLSHWRSRSPRIRSKQK